MRLLVFAFSIQNLIKIISFNRLDAYAIRNILNLHLICYLIINKKSQQNLLNKALKTSFAQRNLNHNPFKPRQNKKVRT